MPYSLFARGHILSRWLEDLDKGDPIAVGMLVVFVTFLVIVGIVAFLS